MFLCFFNEKKTSSKYVCVTWNKETKKWQAQIVHNKKHIYIGSFENENDAAKAVNCKCKELKIPMKNPEGEALDNETLERLKQKVIRC